MGTKPSEKKRKKKGRPSLIDLQKRNLRLQQEQQSPNPNPNSNPKFASPPPHGRITRRNPNPEPEHDRPEEEDEDDEDGASGGKRREKKLKFVLKLPRNASDSACSGSDVDGEQARGESYAKTSAGNGTDGLRGNPPVSGPTTPLPDKKLLVFILDRLQKKDTYGVFSEPVDPEELPDYHEIIAHPMDFSTVRERLSSGAYQNLEQFESDVFLISSNAMTYNAPDTIYYRQARTIQELAKKSFENLRQESDNEQEPKIVRRGRPPSKNTAKRTVGKPPDRAGSDFSGNATLAGASENGHWSNFAQDLARKASTVDKLSPADIYVKGPYGLRKTETANWVGDNKSERDQENPGLILKGVPTKFGKKPIVIDDNRRNTYKQSQLSASVQELPTLTSFDGENQQLLPIGVHMEHAYARSLARFAAKLSPAAWTIAAEKIKSVLPPGTKFGRGWVVGDCEAPQQSHTAVPSTSPNPSQDKLIPSSGVPNNVELSREQELPYKNSHTEETLTQSDPPRMPTLAAMSRSSDALSELELVKDPNTESRFNPQNSKSDGASNGPAMQHKTPLFQFHQSPLIKTEANGFNSTFGVHLTQDGKITGPISLPKIMNLERPMTHAHVLDMVSTGNNNFIHQAPRSHSDIERVTSVGNQSTVNSRNPVPDSSRHSPAPWRSMSLNSRQQSVPPDLNIRFQSPGSPVSGVMVDSQQPDLALQL
ncbi:bromodomain-containing protein 7/9 [Dioscorea alata]|uniref:Bromodomain-containing protein 7/9 n=1 Tax=Dioscorea alata TaxID=55571 RepID=A0ACB7WU99_DIOAL|nr:bromodomain-containing protein 7/9 [Dioscorea alata]